MLFGADLSLKKPFANSLSACVLRGGSTPGTSPEGVVL